MGMIGLPEDCRRAADALEEAHSFETGQAILREAAAEIERLRQALQWVAYNVHGVSPGECAGVAKAALRGESMSPEMTFPERPV